MGHKLNFKNPQRFTEKIQMYKCFYRDPLLKICSDKYTVRGYVESKGLGEYLNEFMEFMIQQKILCLINYPILLL